MSRITRGSGNVFRDLGLPDADVLQAKADLVHQIGAIIAERKMTQVEAARVLGITQPNVSALLHGRIEGFSIERIARFLGALGRHVDITVREKAKREPTITVRAV